MPIERSTSRYRIGSPFLGVEVVGRQLVDDQSRLVLEFEEIPAARYHQALKGMRGLGRRVPEHVARPYGGQPLLNQAAEDVVNALTRQVGTSGHLGCGEGAAAHQRDERPGLIPREPEPDKGTDRILVLHSLHLTQHWKWCQGLPPLPVVYNARRPHPSGASRGGLRLVIPKKTPQMWPSALGSGILRASMTRTRRIQVLVGLDVAALLALAALVGYGYHQAFQARDRYAQIRARLTADIQAARQDGLPATALVPITSELSSIDGSRPPLWPNARTDLYLNDARTATRLEADLVTARQSALQSSSSAAATDLAATQAAIEHDQQIEVPDGSLATFRTRLGTITKATTVARKIKEWQSLAAEAMSLHNDVTAAGDLQAQANSAIQQAAATLLQSGANLGALQQAGNAALVNCRNDATVASYEAKPGRFKNIAPLMDVYNQVEHYAARLGSPDISQAAYGTAAIQRYSAQVHQMFLQGLGAKHIIVSFQAQRALAYENGNVVMDSLVTTGIRGNTSIGTDFGPMKVLFRSHPYTMRSPWPKTSPFWYPNTVVQWTTFFTPSESFHDASWEPDSLLGPGSQFNASTRSHGCIHLPYSLAQWMFGWAGEGTPVDVFPGNGQPVAEQLSEMTTDSQGNPLNPVL